MPTARRDRKRAAAAGVMGLTLLLAPVLLLRNPTAPHGGTVLATAGPADADLVARRFAPRTARSSHTGRIAAQAVLAAAAEQPVTAPAPAPSPTPTTAVRRLAAASATTTTTHPRPQTTTTTRPRPSATTTTTTAPPPPATTAAPAHSETGEASWYTGPDGECAHNSAPLGSIIRVTNLANGKSTTCRVAGRGPYGGGRVVDLSKSTFARVASVDAGVFHARVDW